MRIPVHFPGGACVTAKVGAHVVTTDQPREAGGAGLAPAPFELFLASIATCAGIYALRFCETRHLSTAGLALELESIEAGGKKAAGIRLKVRLPENFPEQYRAPLLRAVDQCAVKRHLLDPPEFDVELVTPGDSESRHEIPAYRSLEVVGSGSGDPGASDPS